MGMLRQMGWIGLTGCCSAAGANGIEGTQDDARNYNGCAAANGVGNCGTIEVRAAYMLVRNFAGFQGLSVKAGRQYVVFGNQSLFGASTGPIQEFPITA